jgi:hypothetical protein
MGQGWTELNRGLEGGDKGGIGGGAFLMGRD